MTKRMPNGYGAKPILRKDGRYQINVTLPTGKRKSISAATPEEAVEAAKAALDNEEANDDAVSE